MFLSYLPWIGFLAFILAIGLLIYFRDSQGNCPACDSWKYWRRRERSTLRLGPQSPRAYCIENYIQCANCGHRSYLYSAYGRDGSDKESPAKDSQSPTT